MSLEWRGEDKGKKVNIEGDALYKIITYIKKILRNAALTTFFFVHHKRIIPTHLTVPKPILTYSLQTILSKNPHISARPLLFFASQTSSGGEVSGEQLLSEAVHLTRVVHVGQFLESWSPVVEVIVVLVFVRTARGERAEAACQRALSLVVVDQGRVVRGHVGVTVCRRQALCMRSGKN